MDFNIIVCVTTSRCLADLACVIVYIMCVCIMLMYVCTCVCVCMKPVGLVRFPKYPATRNVSCEAMPTRMQGQFLSAVRVFVTL